MFRKNLMPILVIIFVIIFSFLNFDDIRNSTSASTTPAVRLPIIMYHEVNTKNLGNYIVSPLELEEDIIYLKKEGYTTINIEDLVAFEYNNIDLPKKPLMLTFDDGYFSSYSYILPILKKYDCKAVISIVGKYVDESTEATYPNGYVNWSQVKELVDSPYVEIQNHTYSMHEISEKKGCKIIKDESFDEYKTRIVDDIGHLQLLMEEKTSYTPKAFIYPFGITCKECDEVLKEMGFTATLTCYSGVNLLSGNTEELYGLKRFNRPSGINRTKFFKQLEK